MKWSYIPYTLGYISVMFSPCITMVTEQTMKFTHAVAYYDIYVYVFKISDRIYVYFYRSLKKTG
jgi:hypothetical protein